MLKRAIGGQEPNAVYARVTLADELAGASHQGNPGDIDLGLHSVIERMGRMAGHHKKIGSAPGQDLTVVHQPRRAVWGFALEAAGTIRKVTAINENPGGVILIAASTPLRILVNQTVLKLDMGQRAKAS